MAEEVRRGYAKGRLKREEILDAATAIIGEVGYRSASLREISARVGISHPGLLHHFSSKEALLSALLARRDDRDTAWFLERLDSGATFFQTLLTLLDQAPDRADLVELNSQLAAEATFHGHPAHAFFRDRYAQITGVVREALAELESKGELHPGLDLELVARTVLALVDGANLQWLYARDGADVTAGLRHYLTLIGMPAEQLAIQAD